MLELCSVSTEFEERDWSRSDSCLYLPCGLSFVSFWSALRMSNSYQWFQLWKKTMCLFQNIIETSLTFSQCSLIKYIICYFLLLSDFPVCSWWQMGDTKWKENRRANWSSGNVKGMRCWLSAYTHLFWWQMLSIWYPESVWMSLPGGFVLLSFNAFSQKYQWLQVLLCIWISFYVGWARGDTTEE